MKKIAHITLLTLALFLPSSCIHRDHLTREFTMEAFVKVIAERYYESVRDAFLRFRNGGQSSYEFNQEDENTWSCLIQEEKSDDIAWTWDARKAFSEVTVSVTRKGEDYVFVIHGYRLEDEYETRFFTLQGGISGDKGSLRVQNYCNGVYEGWGVITYSRSEDQVQTKIVTGE